MVLFFPHTLNLTDKTPLQNSHKCWTKFRGACLRFHKLF